MASATEQTPDDETNVRPILREVAGPTVDHTRSVWHAFDDVGLNPERLVGILQSARDGRPGELLEFAERIIERDAHVRSLLQTRLLAVAGRPVAVEPASEEESDVELAEAVRTHLVDKPDFRRLRTDLLDAVWRSYSVAEIMWDTTADPWRVTYRWRHPQWFVYDRFTGRDLLLYDGRARNDGQGNTDTGEPLPPNKFICHEPGLKAGVQVRAGLMWPVAVLHLFASYALRYWMALAEVHGQPFKIGHASEGMTKKEKAEFEAGLASLGRNASAVLPPGASIEFPDVMAGGLAEFHDNLLRWLNQEKSKAILGQTMTSEDGSSLAQAEVHDDVREAIRDADARALDDTLNEQLVKPWVIANFGPQEAYPQIQTDIARPEDALAVAQALAAASNAAGQPLPVTVQSVRERLGYPEPEEGDVLIDGRVMGSEGQPEKTEEMIAEEEAEAQRAREEMEMRFGGGSSGEQPPPEEIER